MDGQIKLKVELPPRLRTAIADRRRLEQVVSNLAGNAIKFSPAGSTVVLAGWFDGPVALVAVRDAGSGIGPEDLARLFERFYRMSGHERVTGTGLGLPIARDLARAMGGDLDVASVPGSGSSFVLALPAIPAAETEAVTAALIRAVAAEEVRLEERAVIRAVRSNGRVGGGSTPRALPWAERTNQDYSGRSKGADRRRTTNRPTEPSTKRVRRTFPRGSRTRPVRLRAIDGKGGRPDAPTPA